MQHVHLQLYTFPRYALMYLRADSPVVAEFGLRAALLLAHGAVARERYVPAHPAVAEASIRVRRRGDLLAGQRALGGPRARLVRAHTAAVAEGAVQHGQLARAAVRGLAEQVRVAPGVPTRARQVFEAHRALRAPYAAPQRDQHREQHSQPGPQQQRGPCALTRLGLIHIHFLGKEKQSNK